MPLKSQVSNLSKFLQQYVGVAWINKMLVFLILRTNSVIAKTGLFALELIRTILVTSLGMNLKLASS